MPVFLRLAMRLFSPVFDLVTGARTKLLAALSNMHAPRALLDIISLTYSLPVRIADVGRPRNSLGFDMLGYHPDKGLLWMDACP